MRDADQVISLADRSSLSCRFRVNVLFNNACKVCFNWIGLDNRGRIANVVALFLNSDESNFKGIGILADCGGATW